MAEETVLAQLENIEQVLRRGLLGDSGEFEYSRNVVQAAEARTVQPSSTTSISPGETKAVVNLEIPDGKVFLLSGIGTNDIPNASYEVLTDGNGWEATPAPIGTVARPFNCLEELGGYITVTAEAAYLVQRDSGAGSSEDWSGLITGRMIEVV